MIKYEFVNNNRDVRIWDDSTDFYVAKGYDTNLTEKKGVCYTSFIESDITIDEFNEFIEWCNNRNVKINKLRDINAIKVAWVNYLKSQNAE